MRFLLLYLFVFAGSIVFSQGSLSYYILADNVNMRYGASSSSQIIETAEFGRTFQSPVFVTSDWLGFYFDQLDDTIFINRKFIGLESDFLWTIKSKQSVSGRGKYELLKIKIRNDDYAGSQELLFDILNNHAEFLNTFSESCEQLNVLALEMYFNGYPNSIQSELIKKVVKEVKDKNIRAMATYIALKYSIIQKQSLLSEFYIKQIITGELQNLYLQGCDYSTYFSTYPIIEAKKVICAFFLFCNEDRGKLMINYIESQVSKEKSLKSDFCSDLLKTIYGNNFDQHWEYKNK